MKVGLSSAKRLLIACTFQVLLVAFLYPYSFGKYGQAVYAECVMAIAVTHSMFGLLLNTFGAAVSREQWVRWLVAGVAVAVSYVFVEHTGLVITISYEVSMLLPVLLDLRIDVSNA
jgi:hypothetical protein